MRQRIEGSPPTAAGHGAAFGERAQEREAAITARVSEISEQRAAIEQVKGMLMLVYSFDEDAAFRLLKWQSQTHNVKIRALAEQIGADLLALPTTAITDRTAIDRVVMTAYERLPKQTD